MRQTDPTNLPTRKSYNTFTPNNTSERSPTNKMHFPQHQGIDPIQVDEDSHESAAAMAARGPSSRQPYHRDRLPQLPSESRDYSRTNVPVTSTDSSDSSASAPDHNDNHYQQFGYDGSHLPPPQGHNMMHPRMSPQHNTMEYQMSGNRQRHSPANPLEGTTRTHGRIIRTDNGALVEVSEEVYAVRKAALAVLDPITYCWVRFLCH